MRPEPVDPVFVVFSVERRADVLRSLLEVGDDVQFSDDEREKLQAWMTAAQEVARDGRHIGADGCALMLDLRRRWQSAIPKGERPAGWVLAQNWTPHVADAVRDSVEAIGRLVDKRKGRQRQTRQRQAEPRPLTPRQSEAIQLAGECKGNLAKAARQMGVDRKTFVQHYKAGLAKLGTKAAGPNRMKPQKLPTDRRGQANIVGADGRKEQAETLSRLSAE